MLFEYVDQDEAEFLYEVSRACECCRVFNRGCPTTSRLPTRASDRLPAQPWVP